MARTGEAALGGGVFWMGLHRRQEMGEDEDEGGALGVSTFPELGGTREEEALLSGAFWGCTVGDQ